MIYRKRKLKISAPAAGAVNHEKASSSSLVRFHYLPEAKELEEAQSRKKFSIDSISPSCVSLTPQRQSEAEGSTLTVVTSSSFSFCHLARLHNQLV